MVLELHDTSPKQSKTPEMYKDILLGEFGLELDIEKSRKIGNNIREFLQGEPTIKNLKSAIRAFRDTFFDDILYNPRNQRSRTLEAHPECLFILRIWTTPPSEVLKKINIEGKTAQNARRLSEFFRRDGNEYALAVILGFSVPSSTQVIAHTTQSTETIVSQ